MKHSYVLDGSKILRETFGTTVLTPIYDTEDAVCGIVFNNQPFFFMRNLQGDVIGIVNRTGAIVAQYSYDAWGACTILSDTTGNIAALNPFRYRGYYFDTETNLYYLQSRYYDPVTGRFLSSDMVESVGTTYDVVAANLYSYCECEPIGNHDNEGNTSWNKALDIFNRIGKKAKELLDYIVDSADFILGIKTDIDWKIFSKIASEIKRSPHKVKQWFNWLKQKLDKLSSRVGKIAQALAFILFFSSIANSLKNVKTFVKEVVTQVFTKVAEGLAEFLKFCVTKGIKFLSKFVPALGGILGHVLGTAIGRLLDIFFEKSSKKIINRFLKEINVYDFRAPKYITTYFACLA